MAVRYNLIKKKNPQKRQEEGKWYAVPNSAKSLDMKDVSDQATANTTLSAIELEGVCKLLSDFIPQQLLHGHTLSIPGFGTFRLTFKSEGADDILDFNAGRMIKNPRIVFVPHKKLANKIISEIKYENGGVMDGDIKYASVLAYRRANGLIDEEDGTEGGEEEGGSPDPM